MYRTILALIFILSSLFGNTAFAQKSTPSWKHDTTAVADTFITDNPFRRDTLFDKDIIWYAIEDTASRMGFRMVKARDMNTDTLTPAAAIAILNRQWYYVNISEFSVTGDTIHVYIPYSNVLTSSMGRTGGMMYLATVTYTLTEIKGITYVDIDFEDGAHFSPGTGSRKDIEDALKK